jgi:hypothetical protein
MKEMIEKIPALAPLNKIIDEINDLLNQGEGQENESKPIKYWIAGGAVTAAITGDKINDFDIFSPTPELLRDKLKEAIGYSTFEHDFFTNFYVSNQKVQVITRYSPESQEAIFNTFDFTINCGAYDGLTFAHHDRFWQDIATKRLVVNELFFPLKTMERVAKYSRRGYKVCPVGLLNIAKAINALQIDWDNPSENDLSFYPDGTPRFMGPD